jgi:oligopeptide/dipeptide ABC transporter ATP-binding protein
VKPVGTATVAGAAEGRPSDADQGVLLDVRDLRVQFGAGPAAARAVRGVSLQVRRGEAVGLVGESGSGKSVTALALLQLLPSPPAHVTGTALFEGRDVLELSGKALRRTRGGGIAMIFQEPLSSLNPTSTVGHQIGEALAVHLDMRGGAARRRALELLELVGIPDAARRLGQYPHEFSGGMRQRAMIAAALASRPRLLIADEPTTALDVTVQAQILELLAELRRELGMAIVMITHDLGVVARLVDRVNIMYAGRIAEYGDAVDVLTEPRHPYTLGLLESVPRIDHSAEDPLVPIEGLPPDVRADIAGCPFEPRCRYSFDRCREANPPLLPAGSGRGSACWLAE